MPRPSLLGLPRELRDKIYRFLLVSKYPLRPKTYRPGKGYRVFSDRNLATELLRVNKQLQAEATQVIIECHTINLGSMIPILDQQRRILLQHAPCLDIKVSGQYSLPELAAFLAEHHSLKLLRISFDVWARNDADLLKCREPYHLLPLGRLRVPGKVELTKGRTVTLPIRMISVTPPLDPTTIRSAEEQFRQFLKKLEERMMGNSSVDDTTPLFEGQDMSRLVD